MSAPGRLRLASVLVLLMLPLCLAAAEGDSGAAEPSCPEIPGAWLTFGYQGEAPQYVRAPAGVETVTVQVRGGHGGHSDSTAMGGSPALVEGRFGIEGRPCLEIYVADWGGGTGWGYGNGGGGGKQLGPGHDGAAGGGASALVVGGTPLIVAGGGGGGGGAGNGGQMVGGSGGDGAGGEGPGTPIGGKGGNGMGVTQMDLGGMGGAQSGRNGGHGVPGTIDIFAGAGGGGGGGAKGGGGGGTWMATSKYNFEAPYGGGGGGGGNSAVVTSIVQDAAYRVAGGSCGSDGAGCRGVVSIQFDEHPSKVTAYAGDRQKTPIASPFASPLEARVTAASGDPLPDVEVTFGLPESGPGGAFAVAGDPKQATAMTDSNGIATSPPIRAGRTAGHWTATAAVQSVRPDATFALANEPAETATAVHSAPDPSSPGEPVTLSAVVGASPAAANPPVGKVVFRLDGQLAGDPVPLGPDGVAITGPLNLEVGDHSLSASFEGSGDYVKSEGEARHKVRPGETVVTLDSDSNPSPEGAEVTFEAEALPAVAGAGTPTGTVRFKVDGEDSGPPVALASGRATTTIAFAQAGPHVVRAAYSGDSGFAAATGSMVQSVGDEATATTVASSSPASLFGDPLTLTATVTGPVPPTGTVAFMGEGAGAGLFEICPAVTLTAGQAACQPDPPLPPGEFTVLAGFEPDQVGVLPSEGRAAQLVLPALSETSVDAVPGTLTFGHRFQGLAEVGAASPGPVDPAGLVRFSLDGSPLGDPMPLEAGQAMLPDDAAPALGVGPHPLTASFGGDPRFRPSLATTVVGVDPADTAISLDSGGNPSPRGAGVPLEASVKRADGDGPIEGGTVRFWADGRYAGAPVPIADGVARTTLQGLRPGDHDLRAYFSGPGYWPSEAKLTQTVDSPPPAPAGPLPCRRRVTLTAAYRSGKAIRFEGAARPSMRGARVHIVSRGRAIARGTVRGDGTFWTRGPARRAGGLGRSRFRAIVNGHRSRIRRPGRPIEIERRAPQGASRRGRPRVRLRLAKPGRRTLWIARQPGCRIGSAERLRRVVANRRGRVGVALPRPEPGGPFFVYRLMTRSGDLASSPIIVRASRPKRK